MIFPLREVADIVCQYRFTVSESATCRDGTAHRAPPMNTNFRIMFLLTSLLKALYLTCIEHKIDVYHHFCGLSFIAEVNFWRPLKTVISCDLFTIRELGSTLYVGLARTAPPTNKNIRLTFLLTQFQEALYGDTPL